MPLPFDVVCLLTRHFDLDKDLAQGLVASPCQWRYTNGQDRAGPRCPMHGTGSYMFFGSGRTACQC